MSGKFLFILFVTILILPVFVLAQEDTAKVKQPAEEKQEAVETEAQPAEEEEATEAQPAEKEAVAEEKTEVVSVETASGLTVTTELCTGIEERMPVGMAKAFPADVNEVYLWSRIVGAQDTTFVKHVWYYKGNEMADVHLDIKSAAWRAWSKKTILPSWTGDWEVKIFDADDAELAAMKFTVGE